MTTITTVAALNSAIAAANADAANTGVVTIDLGGTIALGATALTQIDLKSGTTLDIVGGGAVLNGGDAERGLFVYAGAVEIGNLTFENMVAQGGAGSASGAGGGAGLGGGLFVGANVAGDAGSVTLTGVAFTGNAAIGGTASPGTNGIIGSFSGGGGGVGGAGVGGVGTGGGVGGAKAGGAGGGIGGGAAVGTAGGAGGFGGGGGGGAGYEHSPAFGGISGLSITGAFGSVPFPGGIGGNGGFGGGGGGGGYGYAADAGGKGGTGGFGGGAGGGGGTAGFVAGIAGKPGFGAGYGNPGVPDQDVDGNYGAIGSGGGGLGAGADIFVQAGAALTIAGTSSLAAGTVQGGTVAGSPYVVSSFPPYNQGFGLGNGIFLQGNQTLTLDPGAGLATTIAGVIADQTGSESVLFGGDFSAGAGALLLAAGTVTLTAADTYSGVTTIDPGATLSLTGAGSIANSASVLDNGRFSFAAAGASIRSLAGTSAAATVPLGALRLTLTAASGSFAGVISGTGGLTVAGGAETLTGANTYTGATTIGAGATLALTGANLADTASVADAGQLHLTGATLAKIISGTGALTAVGGTSTLFAADSYTGATTIAAGATLSLAATGKLSASSAVTDSGVLDLNGQTVTNIITGAGVVAAVGGISTVSAAESFTGGVKISAGTLVLANAKGAGTGAIAFAAATTGILKIDAGDAPANTITGFLPGSTIELAGVGTETTASLAAGNVLTLSGGTTPVTLHLSTAQSYAAYSFVLSADAATGGTDLRVAPNPVVTVVTPGTVEHGQTTELATIVPGRAGDALTLTQTAGSGTLALKPITGGDELIYTAPAAVPASKLDAVSYKIGENGATVSGAASVQLDSGPKAGTLHLTIAPGLNADLTAILLARATAGLPADTLGLTADSTTGTTGTVALLAGDLSYTAPATGTADTFGYTVSDQHGGAAVGTVPVTINAGLATSANVALIGSGNVVIGGNGTNIITGGTGGNLVSLGGGTDTVNIGGTGDTILLGSGTDTVTGTQGMAFIVTAGNGHDMITVGGSHNTIDAVGGTNAITGGTGDDTFQLPVAGLGFDTITGFTEANGDVLDLRDALATSNWNGAMATLGHYLHVADAGGGTMLSILPGGSGSSIAIAQLTGVSYGLADLTSHLLL